MDKLKAMAEALGTGITNQWDKGRPFREMMGAALTGNFGDVGNIAKDYAATVTPQGLDEGIMNFGVGFAAPIKDVGMVKWIPVDTIQHPAGTQYSPRNNYLKNPDYKTPTDRPDVHGLPTRQQYEAILNEQTTQARNAKSMYEENMRRAIEADARRAAENGNLQPSSEIPSGINGEEWLRKMQAETEAKRLKLEADRGWVRSN